MVKHLLEDLDILGFGKTKFVMDRGFYSEDNINGLYKEHVSNLTVIVDPAVYQKGGSRPLVTVKGKRGPRGPLLHILYDLPIRVLHVVIRFCIMLLCNGPLTRPPGQPMDWFGAIYFIGGE